jgi:hypothetical protein
MGITPAHADHMTTLAGLTPQQFERFLNSAGGQLITAGRLMSGCGAFSAPKRGVIDDTQDLPRRQAVRRCDDIAVSIMLDEATASANPDNGVHISWQILVKPFLAAPFCRTGERAAPHAIAVPFSFITG